ncbi:LysR family transcriptional regulator [Thermoflavimicrobium daqui]|jgi:DNA-binding transcriptional LysR family regulator|uniref:LysR family transcriptional regulator n=1 Tax=Thermoflavimicrobium daqui TaxID=2137476 RepID=A0A364K645_9BACL|nr:LysR family transcriptional regulator [Thermoflavimicrobium daqui]RAL25763.1 LysR family transcriptional regulator [Thermoflavimicrobium daqui]
MTLLQFEVFIMVVETKSFTKASQKLGFTQSAVSQMVKKLESELGVTLLNRSRTGVSPTKMGEKMLQHMREVSRIVSIMKQEAAASIGLEIGTLRIGSTPSVSYKLLPGIIGGFRRLFPGIEIRHFEGDNEEVNDWIEKSIVDIGFISSPSHEIEFIPLLKDEMLIFVPDTPYWRQMENINLKDTINNCFIMPKGDCENLIFDLYQKEGLIPKLSYEVSDPTTILAMVQEEIGLTILPKMAVPRHSLAVHSLSLKPQATRTIGLGIRSNSCISPVVNEWIIYSKNYVEQIYPKS